MVVCSGEWRVVTRDISTHPKPGERLHVHNRDGVRWSHWRPSGAEYYWHNEGDNRLTRARLGEDLWWNKRIASFRYGGEQLKGAW